MSYPGRFRHNPPMPGNTGRFIERRPAQALPEPRITESRKIRELLELVAMHLLTNAYVPLVLTDIYIYL